jgi:hypothetical protein
MYIYVCMYVCMYTCMHVYMIYFYWLNYIYHIHYNHDIGHLFALGPVHMVSVAYFYMTQESNPIVQRSKPD